MQAWRLASDTPPSPAARRPPPAACRPLYPPTPPPHAFLRLAMVLAVVDGPGCGWREVQSKDPRPLEPLKPALQPSYCFDGFGCILILGGPTGTNKVTDNSIADVQRMLTVNVASLMASTVTHSYPRDTSTRTHGWHSLCTQQRRQKQCIPFHVTHYTLHIPASE